jgi:hypothetical protein
LPPGPLESLAEQRRQRRLSLGRESAARNAVVTTSGAAVSVSSRQSESADDIREIA